MFAQAGPPNTRTTARERRRAETRDEILAAAWKLARESGLAAISLRDLAAEVGMRAPSLYSYFDSKNAIYDAMFRQGNEQLGAAMAGVMPERAPTRADVKRAVRAFFEFCTDDPARYQLLFQRTVPGFEPSPESYALAVMHLDEMTRRLREAGVGTQQALDLWTALITGLTDQQISNDPGGDRWARLLDEAVDMFFDHVGALPLEPRSQR